MSSDSEFTTVSNYSISCQFAPILHLYMFKKLAKESGKLKGVSSLFTFSLTLVELSLCTPIVLPTQIQHCLAG